MPKLPCSIPGCPGLTDRGQYCADHKRRIPVKESAHRRGYTRSWQKASKRFLREKKYRCEIKAEGCLGMASEVDHIVPHEGDLEKFWDEANWQAVCKPCHSRKTIMEKGTGRGD